MKRLLFSQGFMVGTYYDLVITIVLTGPKDARREQISPYSEVLEKARGLMKCQMIL